MMRVLPSLDGVRLGFGWAWLCGCLLVAGRAGAQEVILYLHTGDRIGGTITLEETNRVVLKTRWAPALSIPVSEILRREIVPPVPEVAPAKATNAPGPGVAGVPKPGVPASAPAVAAVQPKPPQRWFGDLQFGLTLLFGEKDQQLYTGRAKLTYAHARLRNAFDYLYAYGQTDGDVTANRMEGSMKTDFDLFDRVYVYNQGGAGYDEVRLIDLGYSVGPGFGYHLITRPTFAVNTELGANYQVQDRSDGSETSFFYFRLAEDFTWRLSSRLTLDEKFEFCPEVEDWSAYRFRLESNLRYLLGNNLALTLTLIDQYDTNPAKQVVPNDLQVRSSIGVKF